jgi:hypothetical protein
MKEIKNPLVANIDRSNGEIEVSIAKKYNETEAPVFEKFMSMCSMYDTYAVNTAEEDDKGTYNACSSLYSQKVNKIISKMEANIYNQKHMLAGLSDEQKKNLPKELQEKIVKKMKSEGTITKDTDASLYASKGGGVASLFSQKAGPNMV